MQITIQIKRKKYIPILVFTFLCICLFIAIFFVSEKAKKNARAAGKDDIKTYYFDAGADFRVLEIVPYHGMGEVGYMVKGEEPIDLDGVELCKNYETYYGPVNSLLKGLITWDPYYHHKTKLDEGERAEDYNIGTIELEDVYVPDAGTKDKITSTGYFERVEAGQGLYKASDQFEPAPNKTGSYVADVDYFDYNWNDKGDYNLFFTTQTSKDWDQVSVMTQWGEYEVNNSQDVVVGMGNYSKSFAYQAGEPNHQNKRVSFTYQPKTSDTDHTVRYRAEKITNTSGFSKKYYRWNGTYYVYDSNGNGTDFICFIPDASGNYVSNVIGDPCYWGDEKQLNYKVDYLYTPGAGDTKVTFKRRTDPYSQSTKYYVRSDYVIDNDKAEYDVYCKKVDGKDHYIPSDHGDFNPVLVAAIEKDRTGADYVWVDCTQEDYSPSNKAPSEAGFRIFKKSYTREKVFYYRGTYHNEEVFKKRALRLKEDEIETTKVDVLTLTPLEVNANLHLIAQTDFFYITPSMHNIMYIKLYEQFHDLSEERFTFEGRGNDIEDLLPNFYFTYTDNTFKTKMSNDLTWEATYKIFKQIVEEKVGLYYDCVAYTAYQKYWTSNVKDPYNAGADKGTSNNIAKLYMMLMQREPQDFYETFFDTKNPDSNGTINKIDVKGTTIKDEKTGFTISTGCFNAPKGNDKTKVYWNQETFLPEVPNGVSNPEEYYKQHGIDNPWVSLENEIVSVHITVGSFKSELPLNGTLEQETWADQELLEYIMIRDGLDEPPSVVTGYDMINYIIHRRWLDTSIYKTKLKVLDLEPCYEPTLTVDQVYAWCDEQIEKDKITIVPMSTAEFVGKAETLSETYDLIYMGLGTKKMNLMNKQNVYNDSNLDNKIYLHIGDLVKVGPQVGGLLDCDYVTKAGNTYLKGTSYYGTSFDSETGNYRYSGNDITTLKMKELQAYVDQGFPLVLADEFYSGTNVDDTKIDNSSYIYQFLQFLEGKKSDKNYQNNVVNRDSVKPKIMARLLLKQKLTLVPIMDTWPAEYKYDIDKSEEPVYIQKNEVGIYELNYKFKIQHIRQINDFFLKDPKYNINFYVDQNGDGRFTASERKDAIVLKQDDKVLSKTDGKYELKNNIIYSLTYQVEPGHYGILPYKLEIVDNENQEITCSYVGYSAIENDKKRTLKILQIISDDYQRGIAGEAEKYLDLSVVSKQSGTKMNKYISGLKDFNLKFVTITVSEFEHLYITNKSDYDSYWQDLSRRDVMKQLNYKPKKISEDAYQGFDGTGGTSRLNAFDMIVLGFGDHFSDIVSESARKDILFVKDSGRSLLFTHDTTSLSNVKHEEYRTYDKSGTITKLNGDWGYHLNQTLRNLVGMDRYGVSIQNDKTLTSAQIQALTSKKDKPFKAGTTQSDQVKEIQGLTYYALNEFAIPKEQASYSKYRNLAATSKTFTKGTDPYITDKVTNVNRSRITEYPYKIKDDFTITNTHAQYYQLDMEQDEDTDNKSDIIVWYCLSDSDSNNDGIYSCSPNDVANNYYIYSVGNVTYFNLGHEASASSVQGALTSDEETKLFINVLTASFRASEEAELSLTVEGATNVSEGEDEIFYQYLDMDVSKADTGKAPSALPNETDYIKVTFKIESDVPGNAYVNIIGNSDGISYVIYNSAGDVVDGNILDTDEEYSVYIPKSKLEDENTYEVTIQYGSDGKEGKVNLIKRSMFDLD